MFAMLLGTIQISLSKFQVEVKADVSSVKKVK